MKALKRIIVQEGSILTDERPEPYDSGVGYDDDDLLWLSSPFEALFERPLFERQRSSFFKFTFLDGTTAKLKTFPYEKQIEIVQRRDRDGRTDTEES